MSELDTTAPLRRAFVVGFGLVVLTSLVSGWLTDPITTVTAWVILLPAWSVALSFALWCSADLWRSADSPYLTTAAWFGWLALTLALAGPVLALAGWPLTTLVLAGWLGAALGLWLELREEP